MIAIFKRELRSYFNSMVGFLFVSLLLVFTGIFFTNFNLLGGFAAFEYALESATTVFLLAVPILTMRTFAEDKKNKTDKLLFSLPIPLSRIMLGKYLAMLAVLLIPTAIFALYPLILSAFGTVNFGSAYACLLAFFLLGAALISICTFLSFLADSQITAAIISFGAMLFLYMANGVAGMIPETAIVSLIGVLLLEAIAALAAFFLTKNKIITAAVGTILALPTLILYFSKAALFSGLIPALLSELALFDRFKLFSYGILDVTTMVLYLSVSVFCVLLTGIAAEKKHMNS